VGGRKVSVLDLVTTLRDHGATLTLRATMGRCASRVVRRRRSPTMSVRTIGAHGDDPEGIVSSTRASLRSAASRLADARADSPQTSTPLYQHEAAPASVMTCTGRAQQTRVRCRA
jgi:hypothetical protein